MEVRYFHRDKRKGNHSIEELFLTIKSGLKDKIKIVDYYCTSSRLRDILKAPFYQKEINHITGDVNYIVIGLKGKKTVLTVHDLGYFENPVHHPLKKKIYKLFWLSIPLHKAARITTVSEFTKKKILHYFSLPPEKINVIYNPYSEIFSYSPYTYNSAKPNILLIGTGAHKNFERLFEAVKGFPCTLIIIGILNDSLKQKLSELNIDYVNYTDLSREEVYQKYASCDMLFFASLYEGFGLPIIEANAVGRPVITSNVASMPEIAGNAALIIDPYSITEIREAIEKINTSSLVRDQLIRNGIENIKRFDKRRICEQYLSLYQELIS